MLARNLVFAEEVLDDVLATFTVVEGAVSLKEGGDAVRSEMSIGNLLFRELLDAFQDGLVAHL